jgi:hypothetical protein
MKIALAFTLASCLACSPILVGCSGTVSPSPIPAPTPSAQTAAAIVELLQAFGVISVPLTAAQINTLVTYLQGTQTPDVTVIVQDLMAMGVIPTGGLSTAQISAIVALLSSMGYLPMQNGVPVQSLTVKR